MTTTTTQTVPLWDGVRGTCRRFGIGKSVLSEWIRDGKVKARKMRQKRLINQPSVAEHIENGLDDA
jgi:excisionase family DNA binding protein